MSAVGGANSSEPPPLADIDSDSDTSSSGVSQEPPMLDSVSFTDDDSSWDNEGSTSEASEAARTVIWSGPSYELRFVLEWLQELGAVPAVPAL